MEQGEKFETSYPSLAECFPQEGNKVLSGGADNAARAYDLATGQSSQVAQHDAPIKCVRWIDSPQGGILATGSWDKTLRVRQKTRHSFHPILTFECYRSTGTFDNQIPYLQSPYPRNVSRWTLYIPSWLSAPRNDIFKFTI